MHCWARYLFVAIVLVLGIGQMIAACGQKGDLYLPAKAAPNQSASDTSASEIPKVQTGEELEVEEDIATATDVPNQERK